MKRLLITGAAGALGKIARAGLGHIAETIRLTDIAEMDPATGNEEVMRADVSDFDAIGAVVDGCDGIVHLGGQATEGPWETVLNTNIIGLYNVYEAARQTGVKRIIFASSNHAIGFHPREKTLDASARPRPDTLYGVSKVYGEALASLYYDKFGIETAIFRIGSCFPEPVDHRMLSTWLSYGDFIRFIESVFIAPRVGCPVV
jgi:uronate dehydrogenase